VMFLGACITNPGHGDPDSGEVVFLCIANLVLA